MSHIAELRNDLYAPVSFGGGGGGGGGGGRPPQGGPARGSVQYGLPPSTVNQKALACAAGASVIAAASYVSHPAVRAATVAAT